MKKLLVILFISVWTSTMVFANGNKEGTAASDVLDKSQQLVIYSNSASNGRAEWLTEQAKAVGYDLAIVSIPGGDLTNRLIAEKNNSQADLVFGLNSMEYEKLKKADLLTKYTPDWADEVDLSLGSPEGYYYPIVVQPLVIICNNEMKDIPSDIIELTAPHYEEKYNMFDLGGGTGKIILASILVRYRDPHGEYGISEEGWDIAKKFIQNGHINIPGEDYIGNVIDGTRPMSELWGSGVLQNEAERDYQFKIVSPETGVPFVVEQVAIISKSEHKKLAQNFINWFGSKDIQLAWSQRFGSIPANPSALGEASEEVKKFMGSIKSQDMDWGFITENMDMWVEKVELEFIQ